MEYLRMAGHQPSFTCTMAPRHAYLVQQLIAAGAENLHPPLGQLVPRLSQAYHPGPAATRIACQQGTRTRLGAEQKLGYLASRCWRAQGLWKEEGIFCVKLLGLGKMLLVCRCGAVLVAGKSSAKRAARATAVRYMHKAGTSSRC
jgi:hypothetical protein